MNNWYNESTTVTNFYGINSQPIDRYLRNSIPKFKIEVNIDILNTISLAKTISTWYR